MNHFGKLAACRTWQFGATNTSAGGLRSAGGSGPPQVRWPQTLVISVATLSAVIAARAAAVDGVKLLSHAPVVITAPGTYRLKKNLTVDQNTTAITVQANDVTIDLNGFSILGPCTIAVNPPCSPTGTGSGIVATGSAKNVTVLNGTVRGMGGNGISVNGGSVVGVSTLNNGGSGIFGVDNVIDSTSALNGADGMFVAGAVSGSAAVGNVSDGIDCNFTGSVTNSLAELNGQKGINDCLTVSASTANSNGFYGIVAGVKTPLTIPATVVTGCTAWNNLSTGIYASTVTDSTAANNHVAGIDATAVSGCTAISNTTLQINATGVSGRNTCNGSACP